MAESTLDTIDTTWTLSDGYLNGSGVYVLNKGGTLNAEDAIFTTLDDGDLVTAAGIGISVTPQGGSPSTGAASYPCTEDVNYDLSWEPSSNGLYAVNLYVTTDGGQGPLATADITLRVRGLTEEVGPEDSWSEESRASESSTEESRASESSTEDSRSSEASTEESKASDSWGEEEN